MYTNILLHWPKTTWWDVSLHAEFGEGPCVDCVGLGLSAFGLERGYSEKNATCEIRYYQLSYLSHRLWKYALSRISFTPTLVALNVTFTTSHNASTSEVTRWSSSPTPTRTEWVSDTFSPLSKFITSHSGCLSDLWFFQVSLLRCRFCGISSYEKRLKLFMVMLPSRHLL